MVYVYNTYKALLNEEMSSMGVLGHRRAPIATSLHFFRLNHFLRTLHGFRSFGFGVKDGVPKAFREFDGAEKDAFKAFIGVLWAFHGGFKWVPGIIKKIYVSRVFQRFSLGLQRLQ